MLRGSQDGFSPKKFHELCDGKPYTVTFIKVKGTEEIIGGYNHLKWESSDTYGKTKDSFIYSLTQEKDLIGLFFYNKKKFGRSFTFWPDFHLLIN